MRPSAGGRGAQRSPGWRSRGQHRQLHWTGGDASEVGLGRRSMGLGTETWMAVRSLTTQRTAAASVGVRARPRGLFADVSREAGLRVCAGANVGETGVHVGLG